MEQNRMRRRKEQVSCWAEEEVSAETEEEKDDGKEQGSKDNEKANVSEEEDENEVWRDVEEWEEETEAKEAEELEEEDGGENKIERGIEENQEGNKVERVESEVEGKAKDNEDEEEVDVQELETGEEDVENGGHWELMGSEEVVEVELSEGKEAKTLKEKEEGLNGDEMEGEAEDVEEKEVLKAEEMQEEGQEEEKHEVEREVKEDKGEKEDEEQYVGTQTPQNVDESWRNGNPTLEAWILQDRNEREESEKTDEEETIAESWTTHEEEFQDDPKSLQEEESTDDEEAEQPIDDEDSDDEDVVKIYSKDHYATEMFHILTQFRDSSLLTDLTLSSKGGKKFHVHSPVLAAVSSLIWGHLSRSNRGDNDASVGVPTWSVSLDPEVDNVGLEAVVEFAYTGMISCLNKDTVEQIRTAAQALGTPRVLMICMEEEEKSTKSEGQNKGERISAEEQILISLQSIKQLWMDRVGCDVILKARGESLHVHRVILAASCDYFRGMFTLGMRESHEPCVTLPFLMAAELEVLISCSYSGVLPLSWKSVFEITSTALQLQYQPVLSLCFKFLQQEMNAHSCLDVASFAEAYEMVQLLEVADDFVLRQFQKVSCTSKFKDLPAKQLLKYLNSHSLCVPSELVVFKAVVAWIQAKPKIRLRLAKELMKTIHFPLMTFKEFKEVQSLNMWSDHSLAELYEAVFQDFCSSDTTTQSQCRIYLPKESLVLIGGDQISDDLGSRSISKELWFGNSLRNHTGIIKAMEWRRLGEMPEPARFSHEVAVLNGQLYVFGGKKYYGISDTLNSVYRFDPLQNHWENLADMQEKRCSFSVVVLDDKIYAIGGHCDPDYIDSVEQYFPTANSWSFTWPLDLPLSGHVAKVLQRKIFITGGQSRDSQSLASMFLYHPEEGSTYKANMMKPRAHHCMETLGEYLYVAGGITTDHNLTAVDQLSCEVYNPAGDSWTAFMSLPVPHVGAGSAVLEGKFYVLGGYSLEDYTDTKMVHRYDPTIQRWENMGKMPGPNNDIRASLLCLPPHFRL